MRYVLIALYLVGWAGTTVALMRAAPPEAADGRGRQAVLRLVAGGCAIALAAVWPLSGWFLPMIRSAFDQRDG